MLKKFCKTAVGAGLLVAAGSASAGWIDWSSTTEGTMDVNGTSVGVTLTGNPMSLANGSHYYTSTQANNDNTYAGLAPSDVIQVNKASSFTLTFDQALDGLNMALVSVGRGGLPVTYNFEDDFTVVSSGSNHWGYHSYSVSGDDFIGREYNGILSFDGIFNSISFVTEQDEYWHGFNFSSDSLAQTASVSEPASFALLGLGLLGLGAARRKQKTQ